ncbi:MAG: response regulator transcription factor [Lachnospiraceae bacterium]|nr:response regulator transcription factor [Lachnospiraceae bacterium]
MYRVMIVEDDEVIASQVGKHLAAWDMEVFRVRDFRNVMGEFLACKPGLVLMDIGLPFYNGYHWCQEIRKVSKVPILFLSSAADNMNIVMAMNMGGDDFVAKPFSLEVLTAKVQAVLRRAYDFGVSPELLEHEGAVLDIDAAALQVNGDRVDLTRNEYRILRTLMENKGRVVSRELLMNRLWETDCYVDDNTLTVNVTRLRRKLEGAGLPDFIVTKKGIGYLIGG